MSVYYWDERWEECQLEFYGKNFVAIDPGVYGAASIVVDGKLDGPCYSLNDEDHASQLAQACIDHDVKVVVVEDQYVDRNPKMSLRLSFSAGLLAGKLGDVDVIRVKPTVWQGHVLPGAKGRAQLKACAANVSSELRGNKLPPWSKVRLEGLHDSDCIAQWWLWNSEPEAEA